MDKRKFLNKVVVYGIVASFVAAFISFFFANSLENYILLMVSLSVIFLFAISFNKFVNKLYPKNSWDILLVLFIILLLLFLIFSVNIVSFIVWQILNISLLLLSSLKLSLSKSNNENTRLNKIISSKRAYDLFGAGLLSAFLLLNIFVLPDLFVMFLILSIYLIYFLDVIFVRKILDNNVTI